MLGIATDGDGAITHLDNSQDIVHEGDEEVCLPLPQTIAKARHAVEDGDMLLIDFVDFLKGLGAAKTFVGSLDEADLSAVVAARLLKYGRSASRLEKFGNIWRCLGSLFDAKDVSGEDLADGFISHDAFCELLQAGFEADESCEPTVGLMGAVRRFVVELHSN